MVRFIDRAAFSTTVVKRGGARVVSPIAATLREERDAFVTTARFTLAVAPTQGKQPSNAHQTQQQVASDIVGRVESCLSVGYRAHQTRRGAFVFLFLFGQLAVVLGAWDTRECKGLGKLFDVTQSCSSETSNGQSQQPAYI